jgi:hypothetical protein
MKECDKSRFVSALVETADLYGYSLSIFAQKLWWDAMQPYDIETFLDALYRHIKNPDTGQFMPKPADVVRMLNGTSSDAALVAWAKVDKAVRHIGMFSSVVFDDPLIHRVLSDMGGWCSLATKTEDEWPFVGKEFENRYRGYSMRNEKPEYPAKMIGMFEAENSRNGFKSDPPILVGDTRRALAVMNGGTDKPILGFRPFDAELAREAEKLVDNAIRRIEGRQA